MLEFLFIEEAGDRRELYLDYLQHKILPENRIDVIKIQKSQQGTL